MISLLGQDTDVDAVEGEGEEEGEGGEEGAEGEQGPADESEPVQVLIIFLKFKNLWASQLTDG